jgi:ubiquinone/menaquinone biosynthesis C-methylase UbiE
MIPDNEKIQEYWDGVAKSQMSSGRFNWWKIQALTKRMMDYDLHGKTILEIGPGMGLTAASLVVPYGGFEYCVQEPSEAWANEIAKRKPKEIRVGTADALQYADGRFDAVLLLDVLEHIHPESRLKSYNEISRVCKQNAMLFINNPGDVGDHDKNFDYGFFDSDIAILAYVFDGRIWQLETFLVPMLNRLYQFIVIARGEPMLGRFHCNYPSYFAGKEIE